MELLMSPITPFPSSVVIPFPLLWGRLHQGGGDRLFGGTQASSTPLVNAAFTSSTRFMLSSRKKQIHAVSAPGEGPPTDLTDWGHNPAHRTTLKSHCRFKAIVIVVSHLT